MFMTANDLTNVSEPLVDRCTVIQFPNADAQRIKSISRKFVEKKMRSNIYSQINFNYDLMDAHIDNLVNHGITSLRKHQQVLEAILENALAISLTQDDNKQVFVTDDMFKSAEKSIVDIPNRRIGFGK